jgi:hypothetical protein
MKSNILLSGSVIVAGKYDRYDSIGFLGAVPLVQTNTIQYDTCIMIGPDSSRLPVALG